MAYHPVEFAQSAVSAFGSSGLLAVSAQGKLTLIVEKYLLVEPHLTVQLWQFYERSTAGMELETPFKQIIDKETFEAALSDVSFVKFVLYDEDEPVGIGLVAAEVSKVLWLSPSYFTHKYGTRQVHYLLGVVVIKSVSARSRLGAKMLVQAGHGQLS